ncbi:MAG: hypothetical protein EOO52_17630 [Gammaproteobacteria bacterium]|nr:MAG: hypothetical protein EOO52_17630 [Gammaproteobacteria bacterium]
MHGRRLIAIVLGILLVLYPLLVYVGLQQFGPRILACILVTAAFSRLVVSKFTHQPMSNVVWLLLAAVIAGGLTLLTGSVIGLKFYPVIVNVALLGIFGASLYRPPSMIERFARLQTSDLPVQAIAYTRKVTWVWCGFFVFNGILGGATVFASDKIWALYNGLISYILIGLLLAGEYLIRLRVQRKHVQEEQLLEHKLVRDD